MARRWIDDPDWLALYRVASQEGDEPTSTQIVTNEEGRKLADAITSQDTVAQGLRIAGAETAMDWKQTQHTINGEPPLCRTTAMNVGKAAVAR